MNRAETAEAIKVMQAWVNGATVQTACVSADDWRDSDYPQWAWTCRKYRTKPAPKVVPWTAETECPHCSGKINLSLTS